MNEIANFALDNYPNEKDGLFAIFDGHGGKEVSNFCVSQMPNAIFLKKTL